MQTPEFGGAGLEHRPCGSRFRFELLTAGVSGDLAYTVGYEHTSVSWDGTPLEP